MSPRYAVITVLIALLTASSLAAKRTDALALGAEFQVNTYTAGDQHAAMIAADDSGAVVVVWQNDHAPAFPAFTASGRLFDSNGMAIGSEFQESPGFSPAVAAGASGNFVLVWSGGYGDGNSMLGQRVGSTGVPVGDPFQLVSATGHAGSMSAVAIDDSGGFVVVWLANGDYPLQSLPLRIEGQRFDSAGGRVGDEFQVNIQANTLVGHPRIAVHGTGFVVVWHAYHADGDDDEGVLGQRFDSTGARLGTEFHVNTYTTGSQNSPAIAADGAGNFTVVWGGYGESGWGISSQRFDSTGARLGGERVVKMNTNLFQFAPDISADANGDYVVVWGAGLGDHSASGVFGRQFASDGTQVGGEFQVNTYAMSGRARDGGSQFPLPAVTLADNGRFVVAWSSYGQDGSGYGVFARRFALDPLRFGVVKNGSTLTSVTSPQTVALTVAGSWTAVSDQPFISVSPTSGSGTNTLTVQIASDTGLPTAGPAEAHIVIAAPGVPRPLRTIPVNVQVYALGTTGAPFGYFDTPIDNTTGATGAIPVTGWALDDIGVSKVQLFRDPVAGDPPAGPNGKIYIGDATFVAGTRPDVEAIYSDFPMAYRASWGYMLLTNLLPDLVAAAPAGGRGTFTLYAYAIDVEGKTTPLGARTFTCDNTAATLPFGTINTPTQGQTVSGLLDNFGWVLTPPPGAMPTDGSAITLYINGIARGTAQYNLPRSDIQTLFPGYANTDGAVGYFSIDTTTLTNGLHTIHWIATDNLGHADGVGSRYFTVLN